MIKIISKITWWRVKIKCYGNEAWGNRIKVIWEIIWCRGKIKWLWERRVRKGLCRGKGWKVKYVQRKWLCGGIWSGIMFHSTCKMTKCGWISVINGYVNE